MSVYSDIVDDGFVIRTFDVNNINEHELEWHRDHSDRLVTILEGNDWYFQFDNELPFILEEGMSVNVQSGVYHRIHKGSTNLVIKIEE